jgi:two-component system, OmpR family, alkaline phosphatase synthesis response regulator PhoP
MPEKILIIDDDVDIVEAEKVLLENSGYEVISAFDGQEGYCKIRDQRPDLVVLDVIMASPTEGFELTRQLKMDRDLSSIPIVMVTSVRRDDQTGRPLVEEVLEHIEAYIEKPIRPEQFLETIKRVLARRRRGSQP